LSWREGEHNCNGGRCDDNAAIEKFKFDRFEDLTPVFFCACLAELERKAGQMNVPS